MSPLDLPASRLTVKLPLLIVLTALCVAIAAGSVASWTAYSASKRMIEANLSVLARSKRDQIEALIRATRNDLQGTAGNPAVQRALDDLSIGFKILPPGERDRLREKYAVDVASTKGAVLDLGDYYGAAYGAINDWFKTFAREHGYEDVLFVDRDGFVVYSLDKRVDYGSSVRNGPLAGSALAEIVAAASGTDGRTLTSDFSRYEPAGAPVSLSATPIYKRLGSNIEFVGVLVVELSSASFDDILNQPQGFSGQGEALAVGADGRLRSNSRFGARDDVLRTRFNDPAFTRVSDGERVALTNGYRGSMIAAAAPLASGGIRWSVIAAESTKQVFGPVHLMALRIVGICLAITAVLALAAAALARRLAQPVVALVERFDAALSNMPHGLVMVDAQGMLILSNATYQAMYELPEDLAAAGTPLRVIAAHRAATGMEPVDDDDSPTRDGTDATERATLADGRTIDVIRKPIPSGGYVATHQDVTEAMRAQAQIRHLATHDALTGLPNRTRLRDRMVDALTRVTPGEGLAVLCLDLDHFKAVNDTLGHPIGDLLLVSVAARLGECLHDHDTLARLGGDEFVVLKTGIVTPDQAGALARRLIDAVSAPFDLDGHQVVIGMSVGISVAPEDGHDADGLIKNADMALYRAKADGRGASRFFESDMDARLQRRRQLELDLRRALALGEFELAYQPLYDAKTEAITGVEALVRWRHPERGTVSPVEFIPIAEEMGLIVPLGEWVVRRACADAAAWPSHVRVAVNLSSVQFRNPTLVHSIVSALADSGLSPHRLELEITESVLLIDSESTLATLHNLRSLGIRIAMDDFGTGYSSLSYLRSFPFDKIKIDRSFVRELSTASGANAIIKAISDLGASLGMATTAEGVETKEQLAQVRGFGCTEVQGYYYSVPHPAYIITSMLALPLAASA